MQHIDNKSDLNDGYEAYFFCSNCFMEVAACDVAELFSLFCSVHQIFVSEGNLNNRNASLSDAMYIEFQQPHKTTSSKVITVESSPL